MLPRRYRMVAPADFTRTFRRGRHGGTKYFVVHYATGQQHQVPLVGFVVPKRALPLAVDRNRVERRLRHLVAEVVDRLAPDSNLVISVRSPSREATSSQLRDALNAGLVKVGAIERVDEAEK